MTPQDLSGFTLVPFSDLMGMGFMCVAWVSSFNLYFLTSFLVLSISTKAEFYFLQVGTLLSSIES